MPTAATDPDIATLLEHSLWVRRLAGILVRDDARSDDLAQEAWVAVLRHPPAAGQPARPWLSQVVRNLAHMSFRGERRRRAREDAVVQAQHVETAGTADSPERWVERVQAQQALAALVMALEEPYRTTVLLRYYEGLSAADIAGRQGVPAGTIRWRLKKALAQLRAELDRSHGGDRRAWLPMMAPLAIEPPPTLATQLPAAQTIKGVLTMKPLIPLLVLFAGGTAGLLATPRAAVLKPPVTAPLVAKTALPATPKRIDKQQRSVLLQHIQQAQRQAASARASVPAPSAAPALDNGYIRDQIQLLLPLVKECYESALLRSHFSGELVVQFTIVAAKDIGGLVSESSIDTTHSTLTDVAMRECVQESMYAAQFPAPADGGEVHVTYPFLFSE